MSDAQQASPSARRPAPTAHRYERTGPKPIIRAGQGLLDRFAYEPTDDPGIYRLWLEGRRPQSKSFGSAVCIPPRPNATVTCLASVDARPGTRLALTIPTWDGLSSPEWHMNTMTAALVYGLFSPEVRVVGGAPSWFSHDLADYRERLVEAFLADGTDGHDLPPVPDGVVPDE